MSSVGQTLRKKREELEMPLEQIEFETAIPLKKLALMEANKFEEVDNHFFNRAYIKLYAEAVELNPEHLIAIYKRDFENIEHKRIVKKEEKEIKKKIDIRNKVLDILGIFITPKKVGFLLAFIAIGLFGVIAYNSAKKAFIPPLLELESPLELKGDYEGRFEYANDEITLNGRTEAGTIIKINETPVTIKTGFKFESDPIALAEDETEITISASNQLGRKSEIKLTVVRSKNEIKELELIIKPTLDNVSLTIKSDGIVRFDDRTKISDSIRITAERSLEIISDNPASLQTFINSIEYTLSKSPEIFENSGTEVVQK